MWAKYPKMKSSRLYALVVVKTSNIVTRGKMQIYAARCFSFIRRRRCLSYRPFLSSFCNEQYFFPSEGVILYHTDTILIYYGCHRLFGGFFCAWRKFCSLYPFQTLSWILHKRFLVKNCYICNILFIYLA